MLLACTLEWTIGAQRMREQIRVKQPIGKSEFTQSSEDIKSGGTDRRCLLSLGFVRHNLIVRTVRRTTRWCQIGQIVHYEQILSSIIHHPLCNSHPARLFISRSLFICWVSTMDHRLLRYGVPSILTLGLVDHSLGFLYISYEDNHCTLKLASIILVNTWRLGCH